MTRILRAWLIVAVCAALPGALVAQEEHLQGEDGAHAAEAEEHAAAEREHGEHGEGHGHHKHHLAFFLGSTQAEKHHGERDDPASPSACPNA